MSRVYKWIFNLEYHHNVFSLGDLILVTYVILLIAINFSDVRLAIIFTFFSICLGYNSLLILIDKDLTTTVKEKNIKSKRAIKIFLVGLPISIILTLVLGIPNIVLRP